MFNCSIKDTVTTDGGENKHETNNKMRRLLDKIKQYILYPNLTRYELDTCLGQLAQTACKLVINDVIKLRP